MDGVFANANGMPAQMMRIDSRFQFMGKYAMRSIPGPSTYALIFRAESSDVPDGATEISIEFASQWEPAYTFHHPTSISCAYPLLSVTDFAEKGMDVLERWDMQHGAVNHASPEELAAANRKPSFEKRIGSSG